MGIHIVKVENPNWATLCASKHLNKHNIAVEGFKYYSWAGSAKQALNGFFSVVSPSEDKKVGVIESQVMNYPWGLGRGLKFGFTIATTRKGHPLIYVPIMVLTHEKTVLNDLKRGICKPRSCKKEDGEMTKAFFDNKRPEIFKELSIPPEIMYNEGEEVPREFILIGEPAMGERDIALGLDEAIAAFIKDNIDLAERIQAKNPKSKIVVVEGVDKPVTFAMQSPGHTGEGNYSIQAHLLAHISKYILPNLKKNESTETTIEAKDWLSIEAQRKFHLTQSKSYKIYFP